MNKIDINLLKEHPKNKEIYGEMKDDTYEDLKSSIKENGLKTPIKINSKHFIISGHRRWLVCKELGHREIETELLYFENSEDELNYMLIENKYRVKTKTQLMREVKIIYELKQKEAKKRLKTKTLFKENPASENIFLGMETGKSSDLAGKENPASENIFLGMETGKSSDLAGKDRGISGPTVIKGLEVLERIDTEKDEANKWFFQDVMNNDSVETAHRLSKKPSLFVDKVKDIKKMTNKPTTKIINELEKKEYFESRKFDPPSSESKYVESVDDILKFSIDVIIYEGNKYEDLVKIMDRLKPDSYIFIFHDNMSLSKLNPLSEYIKIRGRIINIWKNMEISTNNYSYNKKHSIIYHAKKKDGKDRPLIGDYPDVHFSSTPESIYSFILETASIEGMNVLDITGNVNLESVCLKMKRNYILLKEI
jgi:hypothetical protein